MASTGKMKFDGKISAIKALKEKLADVNQRWHEASRFKEGDIEAIEEEAEFLKAQIAEFESALHGMHEEIQNIVDEMSEFNEMQDMQQESVREAKRAADMQDMEKIANHYREYGIDCEVEIGSDGRFEINVKNDGNFSGQNLLEMSADQLMDLVEEVEKQQVEAEKEQEKSGRERDNEKKPKNSEVSEEEEKKERKPKKGELLPRDAVEERGEEKKSQPSVLKGAKDVKAGEKFDSGLSKNMKNEGKSKGKTNSGEAAAA